MKPILAQTLKFKTKQFKTPFNIQFLGRQDGEFLFSDGVHSFAAGVGNYGTMFGSIGVNTILTVFICTRNPVAPYNLQFRNMRVAPKHCQVQGRLGNPTPY